MIIVDKAAPKSNLWNGDFLKDFENSHPSQKSSTLIWSQDSSSIISQIKFAIDNKVEAIISEILPNEVPDNLLIEEYNFFEKHYIYVPPQLPDLQTSLERKQPGKRIIFRDLESNSHINGVIKATLTDNNISIVNLDNIDSENPISYITQQILDAEVVFIEAKYANPQLLSFISILSLKLKKILLIESPESLSVARLGLLGICLKNRLLNPFVSLRQKISKYIQEKESTVEIRCSDTFEMVSQNYAWDFFEKIFSNPSYIKFTNEISSQEIPEAIWIRPLVKTDGSKFQLLYSRFKLKYFFSIYKVFDHKPNLYLHIEEFCGFLSELFKSPINLSLQERLIAVARFEPKIFNHFESVILDFYNNHQVKSPLMSKIAEIMLTIVSAGLIEQKENFINLAKRLVSKDQALGKIKSFSYYDKFPEILNLDASDRKRSCISILQESCNQINQQNSFTGTLSLATLLLSLEDIENELLNFDLTQNHQDTITINLIFRHGISFHNICWDSQNEFESKFISLKSFFLKLYPSGKFNSFYFNKVVSRLDPNFSSYFENLKCLSIFDILLLIDFSIANGAHPVKLPEQTLDSDSFTYENILLIIIKLANKRDCHEELEFFKNHFNSLPKIQSFIAHPNQLSVIRFLLTLNDSPLLEQISRLDESLNPSGPKPYEFYIQNLT